MKSAILLSAVLSLSFVSQAFAQESVVQVAMDASQKQAILSALQNKINLQQNMTRDEIVADMQATMDHAQAMAPTAEAAAAFANQSAAFMAQVNQVQDAQTLIALEQLQLQTIQSSDNYMFILTRDDLSDAKEESQEGADGFTLADSLMLPFAFAIDLAIFPVTLLMSILTG